MEFLTGQQTAFLFAFLALANEKEHMDIIQALGEHNQGRNGGRKN